VPADLIASPTAGKSPMSWLIDLVRWYNHASPSHTRKHWLAQRLQSTLAKRSKGPAVYGGILNAYQMRLDLASPYEAEIFLNIMEIELIRLLGRLLRPGGVMIDVGANRGICTLMAAKAVGATGKVISFEPNPRAYALLDECLKLNQLSQVHAVQAACWSTPGVATLYDYGQGTEFSSLRPGNSGYEHTGEYQVPTVRLDDEVSAPVQVVKIDAEGAEWEILRGAERLLSQTPRPQLILEFSNSAARQFGYHPLELFDWLMGKMPGARSHRIHRKHIVPIDREGIAAVLAEGDDRYINVWIEPSRH